MSTPHIADVLTQLRSERATLKATIKEQKFQDALALDRLRDEQRDRQELEDRLKYDLALQLDIEREATRLD